MGNTVTCRRGFQAVACAVAIGVLLGPDPTTAGIVERVYRDADGEHGYSVYVPRGESPEPGWPVMLYLHGAGGRGTDGQRHLSDGPAPLLTEGIIDWPILVVFPQCEDVDSPIFDCWQADTADAQRALRILNEVENDYAVDSGHRILTGWSMGGYGVWSVAAATPDRWAAVMPIAGGGDVVTAGQLRETPIWAVHGRLDQAILPERSREMIRAVRRAGGSVVLTLLSNVDHEAWQHPFASQVVLDWFLDPRRTTPDNQRLQDEVRTLLETDALAGLEHPFTPELIIPHAVSVRLGERALEAISFGLPSQVDSHSLGGELDDVHATIGASSEEYEVNLSQLNYRACLERCDIEILDEGRATLRLGIAPLDIVIGQTQIIGEDLLVTTGETLIRVGHRRPVWAEIEIRPCVEDHRLRLKLERTQFTIPDDNWFIRAPAEINVYGDQLSREHVRIGIVGGLYRRRDEFEFRIRDTLPGVVQSIESLLAPGEMEQLASAIWPLPVYQPRLRLRLDDLAVDPHGISVMLGLEADPAVGLPFRRGPQVLAPLGPSARNIHQSDWLEFGIAPGILAPLAQVLIDAGAARIDLSDLPHPRLAQLGERDQLDQFVPALGDLPDDVDVKAELVLVQPFEMIPQGPQTIAAGCQSDETPETQSGPGDPGIPAVFHIGQLKIVVSTRAPGLESPWNPLAEFMLELEQSMVGRLDRHDIDARAIDVRWNGPPRVTATGHYSDSAAGNIDGQQIADSRAPVDSNRFSDLFTAGWEAWTASVANAPIDAPDIQFGGTPLRIERLQESLTPMGSPPDTDNGPGDAAATSIWWLAMYATPATRLMNSGNESLTYQARGPFEIWRAARELQPGEQHSYRTPYPLSVRVVEPSPSRTITIESGEMFQFPTDR